MRSVRLFDIGWATFTIALLVSQQALSAPIYNITLLPSLTSNCKGCDQYSVGYGLNDLGDVVGQSFAVTSPSGYGYFAATLWTNGTPTNLGKLSGTTDSYAYGINNLGQIVGASAAPPIPNIFGAAWQATE